MRRPDSLVSRRVARVHDGRSHLHSDNEAAAAGTPPDRVMAPPT